MAKNYTRKNTFKKDGKSYFMTMNKTGNEMPQPARIIIRYDYWEDVGGVRGWETATLYDRTFKDWNYAHVVYDEILKRGKELKYAENTLSR